MAYYRFETGWVVDAPVEAVFDLLARFEEIPGWWPSVKRAAVIDPGEKSGLGARVAYAIRSPLLYSMVFETSVTAIERPTLIRITATGDVAGIGQYRLSEEGSRTRIRYNWNVSTTRPWMNLVAPIAGPLLEWAYHRVMRKGATEMAKRLGGRLVEFRSGPGTDDLETNQPSSRTS